MISSLLRFPPPPVLESDLELRAEVRAFLANELATGGYQPRCDNWLAGHSPAFTRKLAERGWIGMTWPKRYGGHARTALERYSVIEELLAAGAPVAAHWVSDRQTGPLLLRYGSEAQRARFLPEMAAGRCFFSIGMSEPDSGSDLASIRTSAVRVKAGWLVNGVKVWTSGAHLNHQMLSLVRTSPAVEGRRHDGMSQVIIDLQSPGVEVRAIRTLTGEHHFNEVVLRDALVPDDMVVGEVGAGWQQVTAELAYERSGPERFLSTFQLLVELLRELGSDVDVAGAVAIGRLAAQLFTLRRLSLSVAGSIEAGLVPAIEAALVKDLGTRFERELTEVVRSVAPIDAGPRFRELLAEAVLAGPGFTLRGGTGEILRGIVARGLTAG